MTLRQFIRKIMRNFERSLTRVEDQGVRVEQTMDNLIERSSELIDMVRSFREELTNVRAELRQENTDRMVEIEAMRKRLGVVEKALAPPKH